MQGELPATNVSQKLHIRWRTTVAIGPTRQRLRRVRTIDRPYVEIGGRYRCPESEGGTEAGGQEIRSGRKRLTIARLLSVLFFAAFSQLGSHFVDPRKRHEGAAHIVVREPVCFERMRHAGGVRTHTAESAMEMRGDDC